MRSVPWVHDGVIMSQRRGGEVGTKRGVKEEREVNLKGVKEKRNAEDWKG